MPPLAPFAIPAGPEYVRPTAGRPAESYARANEWPDCRRGTPGEPVWWPRLCVSCGIMFEGRVLCAAEAVEHRS
jgi:hypothetical protein